MKATKFVLIYFYTAKPKTMTQGEKIRQKNSQLNLVNVRHNKENQGRKTFPANLVGTGNVSSFIARFVAV